MRPFPPPSSKKYEPVFNSRSLAIGSAILVLFSNFVYSLSCGAILTILRTQGVIDFQIKFGYLFAIVCLVQAVRMWDRALLSRT